MSDREKLLTALLQGCAMPQTTTGTEVARRLAYEADSVAAFKRDQPR